jgi:hypothetical protein
MLNKGRGLMVKEERLAWIILISSLIIASVAAILWAMQPLDKLVTSIPDDSFFYFQTASNIAKGYVPSMDGTHIGNGYHPLWMYVLVPVFALKTVDLALPVHIALLLCGFFFVVSGFNIFRLFRLLGAGPMISACAALTFLIFTNGFLRILDGEVTSLNIFILSFMLINYIKIVKLPDPSKGHFIGLGIMSGFLFLTRFDNIIILLLFLLHYIIVKKDDIHKSTNLLTSAIIAAIIALPWLVYSFIQFGTLTPTSSWAMPAIDHLRWEGENPSLSSLINTSLNLILTRYMYFFTFSSIYIGIALFYVVLFAMLFIKRFEDKKSISLLLLLLSFIIILYILNVGIRWYYRDWHFGVSFFINHIILWYVIFSLIKSIKFKNVISIIAAAVLIAFSIYRLPISLYKYSYPWQTEMMRGGIWASKMPNTRIGVINCGIAAYFSVENIVDLDGNMNISAFNAINERRMYDYCKRENIEYILDYDIWVLEHFKKVWPENDLKNIVYINDNLDDPDIGYIETYKIPGLDIKYCLYKVN